MRKTLTKGAYVKLLDIDGVYTDSDDVAKKIGSTDKLHSKKIQVGSCGDVMGEDGGYVLVDFGDTEELIDVESLEITTSPTEIKFLVRFMKTNAIEEYAAESDIKKRLAKLISEGHIKLEDEIRVYNLSGTKILKMKLDIFLE